MKELVQLLTEKKLTISSVESLTAGLFCAKMAEVEHASAVLYGGIVTYQTDCKRAVLKIDENLIAKYGVVSKECAIAMVNKGAELLNSDIVVSFTGNAGPTGMENKPVGLVYLGIKYLNNVYSFELNLKGTRNEIREQAVVIMCDKVKEVISK